MLDNGRIHGCLDAACSSCPTTPISMIASTSWPSRSADGLVIGRTPTEVARLRRAMEQILTEWTRDLVAIVGERTALGKVARWLGKS